MILPHFTVADHENRRGSVPKLVPSGRGPALQGLRGGSSPGFQRPEYGDEAAPCASSADTRLAASCQHDPDIGPRVPRSALVVAEDGVDLEACGLEAAAHLGDGDCAERQRESSERAPAPGAYIAYALPR